MTNSRNLNQKPDMLNKVGRLSQPFVYMTIIGQSFLLLILVIIMIYLSFFFRKGYIKDKGYLNESEIDCRTSYNDKNRPIRLCISNVSFKSNNIDYIKSFEFDEQQISIDQNKKQYINIEYDPRNPYNTVTSAFEFKWPIVIFLGFFIMGILFHLIFLIIFKDNQLVSSAQALQYMIPARG